MLGTGECAGIDIIVECDGKEWHDGTADQAQRDRARDRYLQASGYIVLRFSGSEIYNQSFKCVCEIALTFHEHAERRYGRKLYGQSEVLRLRDIAALKTASNGGAS